MTKENTTLFRPISLFSIRPDEPLKFPIMVYYEGRYITYIQPGQAFGVHYYNRFIYKKISTLYVPLEHVEEFNRYIQQHEELEMRVHNEAAQTIEGRISQGIIKDLTKATQEIFMTEPGVQLTQHVKNSLEAAKKTVKEMMDKPYLRIFECVPEKSGTVITHSLRTSLLASFLGYQLGFVNRNALEYLAAAGLLHDLGKGGIRLSDNLNLSEEDEEEVLKAHPEVTCQMLANFDDIPEEVLTIIKEHHEHRDGTGYPNGIRGLKMHGLSRVFTIANTFDNLVTSLPGSREERYEAAVDLMSSEMRSHFDPTLLPKALKVLAFPIKTTLI